MAESRKVNDRNLVMFGMPDVPVERELSYLSQELERRPVVQDVSRPVVPATPPPLSYIPPVQLLNLDGLALNPQIAWAQTAGNGGDITYSNTPNFAVDIFNQTGYPEKIWFFAHDPDAVGNLASEFLLVSHNKDTNITTQEWPPQGQSLSEVGGLFVNNSAQSGVPLLVRGWDWVLEEYTNNLYTYDWFYGSGHATGSANIKHYNLDDATFLATDSNSDGLWYSETIAYNAEEATTNFMVLGDPSNEFAPYQMYSDEGDVYAYINNAAPQWLTEIPPLPGFSGSPYKLSKNIIGSGQYLWGITDTSSSPIKLYTWDWDLGFGGSQAGWIERYTFPSVLDPNPQSDIAFDFNGTVTVSPTTGELFWLQETVVDGSSPTRRVWRLNSWAFDTGVRTIRENIFNTSGDTNNIDLTSNTNTATLQPLGVFSSGNIRMTAGGVPGEDGFLVIRGDTCAEALGYVYNQNNSGLTKLKVPVIWTMKGSGATLPAQATLLTHPDLSLLPQIPPPNLDISWAFESYGGIQALATANKLYTWVGINIRGVYTVSPSPTYFNYKELIESRIREWEV